MQTAVLAVALLVAFAAMVGTAAASPAYKRIGTTPPVPAGAQKVGALSGSASIQAVATLQPRDPQGLAAYAEAVSTPGSSVYHHFLSVSQFAQRFGPTSSQISAVVSALKAQGVTAGKISPNHLSIPFTGTASRLASAFSISFARYRLASGRTAYANTAAPAVPAAVAGDMQGVVGLNTLSLRQPRVARSPLTTGSLNSFATGPSPCSQATQAASANSAYTAAQVASAYGMSKLYSAGDSGAGVTVALFELEPYSSTDIGAYQSCYGTSPSAVSSVTVDGGPTPCNPATIRVNSCGLEADLDIEGVIGLAPGSHVTVYQGPNTDSGAYDTYSRIVNDNTAKVISTSWGMCEAAMASNTSDTAAAENTLFQQAATQGQSVYAAAGDSGADDCGGGLNPSVDDPASQPFVTGVGGTSMTSVGPPPAEVVWNDGPGGGAGGGGVSQLWGRPSYQDNFAVSQTTTSCPGGQTCREVPDVTANADENHGYVIYYDGSWGSVGGTSAAAPTWASLTALADSSATCSGATVGFANPALYTAASRGYAGNFNDIRSGNNSYDGVPGYSALTGYDMASGLGSPIGGSLAPAMCGDLVSVTQPGSQTGTQGSSTSLQLSATSSASSAVTYGATGLPPGLSVNSSTGQISGTPASPGTYTVIARATDASGSEGDAQFSWVINAVPSPPTQPSAPAHVTIAPVAPATGRVGSPLSLLVSATDSRSEPLTYSASGLPAGLKIGMTSGLISGTPSRSGVSNVTVTARDSSGSSASTTFRWTVAGRPSLVAESLSLRGARPQLVLKLHAGAYAAALRSLVMQPASKAIGFASGRKAMSLGIVARSGARLKLANSTKRGSLTVSVRRAAGARSLTVTISAPELKLSPAVVASLRAHHQATVRLTLVVKDAQGVSTTLTATP